MADWAISSVELAGGFLAGLTVSLPPGLTCIIGPRGSGKSTLAEAIRYALAGNAGATKQRADLLQANLRGAMLTIRTASERTGDAYIVRRAFQQPATITTAQGRVLADVDIDRGTFLPLDAYGSAEIELIADESLGDRRRFLLDDLFSNELRQVQLSLNELRRQLESNADAVRTTERAIADVTEQIEEMGDARAKLAELPAPQPGTESSALLKASQQQQINEQERVKITRASEAIDRFRHTLADGLEHFRTDITSIAADAASRNQTKVARVVDALGTCLAAFARLAGEFNTELGQTERTIRALGDEIASAHLQQKAEFDKLQSENQIVGQAIQERSMRERAVARLTDLEQTRNNARSQLATLNTARDSLKATYLLERERISRLRTTTASALQSYAGNKVRIRVLENADDYGYRQILTDGLRGARVRNHEDILSQLLCLRPEQLAQLIRENDVNSFDMHTNLGTERSTKILDAYRQNLDLFGLELAVIDDQVKIELNVSPTGDPLFRDAAELSRGQKCTALLPLLLARRSTPLLIDQPEDNLDNHFIYETVVDALRRLKSTRQMVFITHNANIPVLGDADFVIVMNSDGKRGYIEKTGSLDDCRAEIIDLLEGGEEAFEERRKRYAK